MQNNNMEVHQNFAEPWKVTLVDTGEDTMTGGRLKRVKKYLNDEDFCFTYGDGVTNLNVPATIELHKKERRLATITAVQPPGRFGVIEFDLNKVNKFVEKPYGESGWINGGFFVLSPKVMDYIEGDLTIWEREPVQRLAQDDQMSVYFHHDFWQPMDTLREKFLLENFWRSGNAPWKIWK
jgi:glucose-1-phosphate cytidylyltransferase